MTARIRQPIATAPRTLHPRLPHRLHAVTLPPLHLAYPLGTLAEASGSAWAYAATAGRTVDVPAWRLADAAWSAILDAHPTLHRAEAAARMAGRPAGPGPHPDEDVRESA